MSAPSVVALTFGDSIPQQVNANIGEERAAAVEDFLATNNMVPLRDGEAILGDRSLMVTIERTGTQLGLVFERQASQSPAKAADQYSISFSLSPLRRALKEYEQILESYYDAIRTGQAARIEAVDMARRALHNDAAEILIERLDGKVLMDHGTARRLFTIINAIRYDGRGTMR